jgi:hypothetical protein
MPTLLFDAAIFILHRVIADVIFHLMRTTVTLDEASAAIATRYAQGRGISLSRAIAELIVRGSRRAARIKYVDGLPVFDLPKAKPGLTTEQVKALEADER